MNDTKTVTVEAYSVCPCCGVRLGFTAQEIAASGCSLAAVVAGLVCAACDEYPGVQVAK